MERNGTALVVRGPRRCGAVGPRYDVVLSPCRIRRVGLHIIRENAEEGTDGTRRDIGQDEWNPKRWGGGWDGEQLLVLDGHVAMLLRLSGAEGPNICTSHTTPRGEEMPLYEVMPRTLYFPGQVFFPLAPARNYLVPISRSHSGGILV